MKQFLIAFDQLVNTLFYIKGDGFGFADETLSARAWRLRYFSNAYKVIDKMFFWEDNHCLLSYHSEMKRKQLPDEYREFIRNKHKRKENV